MWWDILNLLAGVVIGVITGFYFERRGSKEARAQHEATLKSNEELRNYIAELEAQQLEHQAALQSTVKQVRESVYSTAAIPVAHSSSAAPLNADSVLSVITGCLNVDGQAQLFTVRGKLLSVGHTSAQIDDTLGELVTAGRIHIEEKKVELR